ncbi:MAG: CHD3-type chromatin-remodeling factor PICKLE-like, partial [Trebouxia sp. A1-2]
QKQTRSPEQDSKDKGKGLTSIKEYFVKWKGKSFIHCSWVKHDDVVKVAKYSAGLNMRFKHYQRSVYGMPQVATSGKLEDQEVGDMVNGIDPLWVLADRVIAQQEKKGRKVGRRKYGESPGFLAGGGSLHPYQLEGLNWLYFAWEQRKNVILADEMGLGKTIQSIAFLAALKEEEQVQKPHLVVVPLSTFPNWEREFALWAPQLNVVPFIGNQAGRTVIKTHELYADPSQVKGKTKAHSRHAELQARVKFHVLLTTYEMVGSETGTLRSLEYETLIVDEGHRLKNQQSKLFQQLHNFKTRQRTLLTGTPLQNNLSELWMLLHFLDASKFQSLGDFEADFSDLSHGDQIAKLHELLSPHLLRRLKKDVLKQLPPKKEQIVRVELSPLQKDWYRGILTKNFPNLTNGKQTGRLKSVMMELRKCCNHPFLIDEQEWPVTRDPKQFLQQLVQASGKLALIDSMLVRMKERGHRVLIYSQFTTLLDLLEEWLAARQWGYQRIDGSVGGADRQSRIDQFNRRPADNFVFLLSTKAGGLGINLASADTVIIYDSDWNPHNDLQAQSRAHRLGQLKPVMIYRLVTRLTIEERMMQQTKKKMMLEHLVVHKMNTAADLKQDELDDILRYGAAELFADAVAASQKAQQDATT